MRTIIWVLCIVSTAVVSAPPACSEAQEVSDVMSGIRDGGGWISIPIEAGRGSFSTVTLPTGGMTLNGCVTVWPGHSGRWEIDARERIADGRLRIAAEPGTGVPFSHKFGMRAQIDFDFRWSEARDTTLMLWVGLDLRGDGNGKACEPRYAGAG